MDPISKCKTRDCSLSLTRETTADLADYCTPVAEKENKKRGGENINIKIGTNKRSNLNN